MKKINEKKMALILSTIFLATNSTSFAKQIDHQNITHPSSVVGTAKSETGDKSLNTLTLKKENSYQPYVQLGGTHFFRLDRNNAAATVDLFVPLWQQGLSNLIFTDLRINDRSGVPFEGNIHVGYRHLSPDGQKSFGIYGAFDRRKTKARNYFNQLTLGGEYWLKKFFIGGNLYRPIGETSRAVSSSFELTESNNGVYRSINLTKSLANEKAMSGVDAEVGYEFKDGLVGYVGGYYFGANNVSTICGPRARLTYDWSLDNGRRILGIFDKVGLEAGVQNDTPRGTIAYVSANVRVEWLPSKHTGLHGVSRHMIDPVRRDIDIVYKTGSLREASTSVSVPLGEEVNLGNLGPDAELVEVTPEELADVLRLF